jgi:hypothetical protein
MNCPKCKGPTDLLGRTLRWKNDDTPDLILDYRCDHCGRMRQRVGERGLIMEEKSALVD